MDSWVEWVGIGLGVIITSVVSYGVHRIIETGERIAKETHDLWRWHRPVETDTGDLFPWKNNRELEKTLVDVLGKVDLLVSRIDRLIEELSVERKNRKSE